MITNVSNLVYCLIAHRILLLSPLILQFLDNVLQLEFINAYKLGIIKGRASQSVFLTYIINYD